MAGLLFQALLACAQNQTVSVNLINGDATRDNQTDDTDLLAVLLGFGSGDPEADLNEDGIVDDADLAITLFGFGQTGAARLTGSRVDAYGTHFVDVQVQLAAAGPDRWHEVYIEAQDDVLVYYTVGTIRGAAGTLMG